MARVGATTPRRTGSAACRIFLVGVSSGRAKGAATGAEGADGSLGARRRALTVAFGPWHERELEGEEEGNEEEEGNVEEEEEEK